MKLHAEVALGGFKLRCALFGYACYYCYCVSANVATEGHYNPIAALEQARRYLLQPDESGALPGAAKALPPR